MRGVAAPPLGTSPSCATGSNGARGLRRLVLAGGECVMCRNWPPSNRFFSPLAAAADHTLLHSVADQQRGQPDGVRTARAGFPETVKFTLSGWKHHREVHRDRRVHRLEDVARADHGGVLVWRTCRFLHHGRAGAAVVAVDCRLVPRGIGRDSGLPERFSSVDVAYWFLPSGRQIRWRARVFLQVGMRGSSPESADRYPNSCRPGDDADTRSGLVE